MHAPVRRIGDMKSMWTNAWSGGQYSVFRASFGLTLGIEFARRTPFGVDLYASAAPHSAATTGSIDPLLLGLIPGWDSPIMMAAFVTFGAIASGLLAIGWRDRIAAALLWVSWVACLSPDRIEADAGILWFGLLLILHLLAPPQPFGSWDARGRLDPDGGWNLPNGIYLSALLLLACGYAYLVFSLIAPADSPRATIFSAGFVLLHGLAFNPGWIPSRKPSGHTTVFYDGDCGLCHLTVRILLAEDRSGDRFRYVPIDSPLFRTACEGSGSGFENGEEIPDSVLVQRPGESMLVRAAGVLEIGHQLGGLWRLLAIVVGWLPNGLLRVGYDFIASIRHRLFTRPQDACPILPAHLRDRFSM